MSDRLLVWRVARRTLRAEGPAARGDGPDVICHPCSPGPCAECQPPPPADATHWDARAWGALVLLCGVLFLDGLDVSMVGVALPSIRADLGLSTSQLQWIVSGYVLG